LLEVLDGVYTAVNVRQVRSIIRLDPSVAFDAVQYDILLSRLHDELDVTSAVLSWLSMYVENEAVLRCTAPCGLPVQSPSRN
jgi:hypothetical protein